MNRMNDWQPGSKSQDLFTRAKGLLPGGVNSPVRAFRNVDREPFFVDRAEGAYIWDADGNRYIDYVGSWGPMILGHAHPEVIEAVQAAARRGTSFGAPHEAEVLLAEEAKALFPSVQMLRLVSSGTEAAMSALRLARAFTKRSKVIKFEGCYHGHVDAFLIKAGSGAATFGEPDSPGVTPGTAADTLSARYNDLDSVKELFKEHGETIAAVMVEPVAGNMGCIPPVPGFLEGLRRLCDVHGTLLVFDEIITGFRVGPGGAQGRFHIRPDVTTLGKILGGGLPVGAFGGRRDVMKMISPDGPVYQAGTLSGNPLAVAGGLATLRILRTQEGIYDELERKGAFVEESLRLAADDARIPFTVHRVGSLLGFFFHPGPVLSWDQAKASDKNRFKAFFAGLLKRGVWIAPSPFEALFVSAAHSDADLEATRSAILDAMAEAAGA
jgi:glutamate-1-semialdehyde 2,1-aminomutase